MMNLYRTFKTFLYWAIPSSYRSEDISEFDTANDLVTIYKDLPDTGAYQNRKVSINELKDLLFDPKEGFYELTFVVSGLDATDPSTSPTLTNIISNTFPNSGFSISFVSGKIIIEDLSGNDYFNSVGGPGADQLNGFVSGWVYPTNDSSNGSNVIISCFDSNTLAVGTSSGDALDYDFYYLCCTIKMSK